MLVADPSKEAVAFGKRLRELRQSAGLTLEALGEAAGMSHQSIVKYEGGKRTPTWESLLRLAAALGVDLNSFQPEPDDASAADVREAAPPPPAPNDGKRATRRPPIG